MLIGIPKILSPELLKILCEMGHGDHLAIVDGNFPAESTGKRVVRLEGHGVVPVLEAILSVYPIDTFVDNPISIMDTGKGETQTPPIWDEFRASLDKFYPEGKPIEKIERFDFYDLAKEAYAIIATGESALYANITLQKGVIKDAK